MVAVASYSITLEHIYAYILTNKYINLAEKTNLSEISLNTNKTRDLIIAHTYPQMKILHFEMFKTVICCDNWQCSIFMVFEIFEMQIYVFENLILKVLWAFWIIENKVSQNSILICYFLKSWTSFSLTCLDLSVRHEWLHKVAWK